MTNPDLIPLLERARAATGADVREQIARIIDPSSWSVFDCYLAIMPRKYRGENIGYDPAAFKDKKSLAKADEILALLAALIAMKEEGK
jgi:hypothetical protein